VRRSTAALSQLRGAWLGVAPSALPGRCAAAPCARLPAAAQLSGVLGCYRKVQQAGTASGARGTRLSAGTVCPIRAAPKLRSRNPFLTRPTSFPHRQSLLHDVIVAANPTANQVQKSREIALFSFRVTNYFLSSEEPAVPWWRPQRAASTHLEVRGCRSLRFVSSVLPVATVRPHLLLFFKALWRGGLERVARGDGEPHAASTTALFGFCSGRAGAARA